MGEVVEKFLACGILTHGFARVRCGACRHEFLLAFSCKCRYFCPSCHAKRLALWSLWLEETLLADVPHRQVVLTVPKRLRPYFLSLANWHPHLHLLVTDGGFRPDGTFVHLPLHDVATLTEAFRRAVLRMFVKRELLDGDTAQSMLAWPHAGFHVHDAVRAPADDTAFTVRLARHCARNPSQRQLPRLDSANSVLHTWGGWIRIPIPPLTHPGGFPRRQLPQLLVRRCELNRPGFSGDSVR